MEWLILPQFPQYAISYAIQLLYSHRSIAEMLTCDSSARVARLLLQLYNYHFRSWVVIAPLVPAVARAALFRHLHRQPDMFDLPAAGDKL